MTTLQELYDIYKDTACKRGLTFLQGCISQELTVDEMADIIPLRDVYWAASHSETPADIMEKLSKHDEAEICYEVAENPFTPTHILVQMSTDNSPFVRCRVVLNPNTPIEAIEQMVYDSNYDVRKAARRRLGTNEE